MNQKSESEFHRLLNQAMALNPDFVHMDDIKDREILLEVHTSNYSCHSAFEGNSTQAIQIMRTNPPVIPKPIIHQYAGRHK